MGCRFLLPTQSLSGLVDTSIGTGKGRVPWAELQRAQGDYIKAKYLPEQVALTQYYHLRQEDVNAILKHWTWRQAAGKVPLRFKKAAKTIRQKNHASEENDAGTDMEAADEAEEDMRDDDRSGAQGGRLPQRDSCRGCSTKQVHHGQSLGHAAEGPNGVSWLLKHDEQALTSLGP